MLEATLPPVYGCKGPPYPRLAREEAPRHGGQEATVVPQPGVGRLARGGRGGKMVREGRVEGGAQSGGAGMGGGRRLCTQGLVPGGVSLGVNGGGRSRWPPPVPPQNSYLRLGRAAARRCGAAPVLS